MASSSLQEYQLDSSSVAPVEVSSSDEACFRKRTTTNTKQQQKKKNISIPNPPVPTPTAAADDDDASKAANPKRVWAENGSVVHGSSKKKKSSAPTPTLPVVDVKKKSAANSKPPLATGRIWSEEDEIVILEGYASFTKDKRKYKSKEFYIYIKDRLSHGDCNWTQLRDKVNHLQDKCRAMFAMYKNGPIPPSKLKTDHAKMVYKLSMKAWGDTFAKNEGEKVDVHVEDDDDDVAEAGAGAGAADKLNEKKVQAASDALEEHDDDYVDDRVVLHSLRDYFHSELFDGRWVDDDQLRSLETKWKKLRVSRANYKSAKSQFKALLYQLAVQGYNML